MSWNVVAGSVQALSPPGLYLRAKDRRAEGQKESRSPLSSPPSDCWSEVRFKDHSSCLEGSPRMYMVIVLSMPSPTQDLTLLEALSKGVQSH